MISKLQIWCEAIMEAAWLAAAITIPLFFNASSAQSFEPDKVFVLRFLAIIAGTAWLLKRLSAGPQVKQLAAGEVSSGSPLRHLLAMLMFALLAIYVLSSILSIAPAISWLGLYSRAQGTVTFCSYAILFLAILSELRNAAQLRRLQYAFILTSLPVAGYGILQHFRLDSFPWSNVMQGRSTGTMGNPIFLGAYLAVVIPITFGCLMQAVRILRKDSDRGPGAALAGVCSLALVLQGLALFYTQSRGPVIGLIVSGYLCVFLFLVTQKRPGRDSILIPAAAAGLGVLAPVFVIAATRIASGFGAGGGMIIPIAAVICTGLAYGFVWRRPWGRNWLWLTWLIQSAVLLAVFSFVPIRSIEESMRATPLGRLARLSGNSVDVRRLLWQSGFQALKSGSPPAATDNGGDPLRYFRPVIGFGPENVWRAANSYASPQLARLHAAETVDRMHSETLDNLISLGFAGGLLWLTILAAAFHCALKLIGFEAMNGRGNPFIYFSAIGCIGGVLWPWVASHPELMAVGVVAGMLAGVAAFAAWSAIRDRISSSAGDDRRMFMLGILGALIVYFVETGVGIPVTSTRTYFFILLALVAVFAVRNPNRIEEPVKKRGSKQAAMPKDQQLIFPLLSSFAIISICWSFIINNSNESSALALFWRAWFAGYPGVKSALPVPESLILLLLIFGGSVGLMYAESVGLQVRKASFFKTLARALFLMLAVWLVMAILSAAFWTVTEGASPLKISIDAESRVVLYIVALCLLMFAAAWRLVAADAVRHTAMRAAGMRSVCVGALAVIGVLIFTHQFVLRPARADVTFRIARAYESAGSLPASIQLYGRAATLAPLNARYRISLGLAQASAGTADAAMKQESIRSLQYAVDLNPLDPAGNRTLGAIYMQEAERSADIESRSSLLRKAIAVYQRAIRLAPNYPDAYGDMGRCYFLLGDNRKAESLYERSLQINPYYPRTHMFLGEMHFRLKNVEQAYRDFEKAYGLDRGNLDAMRNLGFILTVLGRKQDAIKMYMHALAHSPGDLMSLRRLSALYFNIGDSDAGHRYARRAYDATPAAGKGSYDAYVAGLQNP